MKIGALDYLIKPFEAENLIPPILRIYEDVEASHARQIDVNAIVLCGGTSYFNPTKGTNTFGYQVFPGVVTSLEFERIMSNSGPCQGQLVRPNDGKPIRKIAWIQCVGSRDLQTDSDFCSNICCMYAIKEALVAKEKSANDLETTIFYMDMRTFGKTYQRYRDQAEQAHGVRFERARVHSVIMDDSGDGSDGDHSLRYVDSSGVVHDERFDLVVISVGQRTVDGTAKLAEMLDIPLNPWGYCQTDPFSMTQTGRDGIVVGGAYSGLKDISESVIQASAAALSASRVIHSSGGGLAPEPEPVPDQPELAREMPKTLVAICTCGDTLSQLVQRQRLMERLESDPAVSAIEFIQRTCTTTGWEDLTELVKEHKPNRILVGACLPYVYTRKIKELGRQIHLNPSLIDVVDIRTPAFALLDQSQEPDQEQILAMMENALLTGLTKLKRANPSPAPGIRVHQRALVVGGGIAGMTAALAVADHGFEVDLVEQDDRLGGNLTWLQTTLEGHDTKILLDETITKTEKHPLIHVHIKTQAVSVYGQVGNFYTTLEDEEGHVTNIKHGVTILATGGSEAETSSYGHGKHAGIMTQKELEQGLDSNTIDPEKIESVVMIQCVDSREEPHNYCSRICCLSALKNALALKEKNPNMDIYVLYRDMMSYGFSETYYTKARKADIIFIQYEKGDKPEVVIPEGGDNAVQVNAYDPVSGQRLQIDADLVVLSVRMVPNLKPELAASFGASVDQDGFFQEAELKWRPVDSLQEGVFACGIAHSPRSIVESITTAEAAAQRSLRIISQEFLPAGKVVATVHHSLCSLCERCIDACPYNARTLDPELNEILVNPVMCQGCGSCAAVCPNGASMLEGFEEQQIFEIIDVALEGT